MMTNRGRLIDYPGLPIREGDKPPELHRASVVITNDLLVQMLHFPVGTTIVDARMTEERRDIELVVDHKDLPVVPENGVMLQVCPRFRTEYCDQKIIFEGWT